MGSGSASLTPTFIIEPKKIRPGIPGPELASLLIQISLDLGGGDFGGAGQIDHFALFLQKVELTLPVVAHDKGVDLVLGHIGLLLLPILLGDDQIHIADGLQHALALLIGEVALLLFLIPVEFIGGQSHHQIVALLLGATQQVDMSVMQQVKSAVGNNSLHLYYPFIRSRIH